MKTLSRTKGTVRFAFKSKTEIEKNKSKEFLIYLFFTHGGRRFKLSTGYKCNYYNWDFKKQKIKNVASIKDKDAINSHLNKLADQINAIYNEVSDNGDVVTSELLKNRLENAINGKKRGGFISPKNTLVKTSLVAYFKKFIENKNGKIAKTTLYIYRQTLRCIEEFEKHNNWKLEFEDIDLDFYNGFVSFLETEKDFKTDTIGKHIKNLKAVMNSALEKGLTANTMHKSNNFKATRELSTEVYLSNDEIKTIAEKNLSHNKNLDRARDIFLIGCYTGQRVSDYNNFSKKDIVNIKGVDYIKFIQKKNYKNKRHVHCPITKEMRSIMSKYDNDFPPKMPEQHINKYIKYIAKMCKITQDIKIEYTKGGEKKVEYKPKNQLIGTHTARRSFASNKYKQGMPVYDIMHFTGHTTEKEFYKYIRIKDEERATHIAQSGFFNV